MNIGRKAQGRSIRLPKLLQTFVHTFDDGFNVNRVGVIVADDFYLGRVPGWELALPLVQTAARGDDGELRIQRQQHKRPDLMIEDLADSLLREWMPVTHGYENMRVQGIAQLALQPAGLEFGQLADRRPATNLGIVLLDPPGTPR
jgi:hypothetical protein